VEGFPGWHASVQPLRPYYEINRSEGQSAIVRIEEVEITEPKDYSEPDIIYDQTKEGFEDEASLDSYSVPVSVAFNVPETTEIPVTTENIETTTSSQHETTELDTSKITTTFDESTTEREISSTTEIVQTSTTTERQTPSTTYSRIYSFINRNRQRTTGRPWGEVFLGTKRPETTTVLKIKEKSGAHKVPHKLWSSFEKSLDELPRETTTSQSISRSDDVTDETSVEPEERNTEGYSVASIMSYSTPDENSNATAIPVVEIVDDLPKPSEHQSEVVVVDTYDDSRKVPKSFSFPQTDKQAETGNIQIHTFGVEQVVPRGKVDKFRKTDTKTKKREEWIKNWVNRKFNKPKFPRVPLPPLAPATNLQFEIATQTTLQPEQEETSSQAGTAEAGQPEQAESHHSFAPTVPPKVAVDVASGGIPQATLDELKSSLIEKYSSKRTKAKNSLFSKPESFSRTKEVNSSPVFSVGVPRGAKSDIFRSYGGDKLSQADFERNILGVSTATEISVKSMICVKGRCFNADDMGKLLPKY